MNAALADSDGYSEYSGDSEDVGERPNRWNGHPSTWQLHNRTEIETAVALNKIRNQDLSIHLYNTFALKRRHDKPPDDRKYKAEQDLDKTTDGKAPQNGWNPFPAWTAWPMRPGHVPSEEFVKSSDQRSTFIKPAEKKPSAILEEELLAAALRAAKHKFNGRPWEDVGVPKTDVDLHESREELSSELSAYGHEGPRPASQSRPVDLKAKDQGVIADLDSKPPLMRRRLKPTVAADDSLSHTLLRPSIRHILTRVDTTLTILHNAREAALDPFQSDLLESEMENASRRSRSRSRSRVLGRKPRLASQVRRETRGRPPKSREPLPVKDVELERPKEQSREDREFDSDNEESQSATDSELNPQLSDSDMETGVDSSAEGSDSLRRPRGADKKETNLSSAAPERRKSSKKYEYPKIGLRDWTDVLGAAALAGFSPAVLDRAARRCADLFGQDMAFQTLQETTPSNQESTDLVHRYHPGMARPPLFQDEEYDSAERTAFQKAVESEAQAVKLEDLGSADERRARSHLRFTRAAGKGRSRPKAFAPGNLHHCTYPDCPRGIGVFTRRKNLVRHMRLIHGVDMDGQGQEQEQEQELEQDDEEAQEQNFPPWPEVDSEDEVYGAVHVDGFLKPIKMRSGWRGPDSRKEPRVRVVTKAYTVGQGRTRSRSRSRPRGRNRTKRRDSSDERGIRVVKDESTD